MKSEALEISIEDWNDNTVFRLRGRFHGEQIPNFREKITEFLNGGIRSFVLDMTEVTELDDAVPPFLVDMLNLVRGKEGDLRLICGSGRVFDTLEKYRNIFDLYPDKDSFFKKGFFKRLQTRGIILSRKTGIRVSRSIALLLFVALTGWFLSLLIILVMQSAQVNAQKNELRTLREWKLKNEERVKRLSERLKPLEDLGVTADTTAK